MQKKGSEPDFSEPWHRSDVVLVVEGKMFHVHKSMLSMWSPVFEKMFSADFREKTSTEIPLPEKKASEIQEMLLVIYPTSKPVTERNYAFLLELAREYQMERVIERCEKYLLGREKSLSQAVDFLVLADEFQMKELSEQCVEIAKNMSLHQLKYHKKYAQIEHFSGRQVAERRVELLEKKNTSLEKSMHEIQRQVQNTAQRAVREFALSQMTGSPPYGHAIGYYLDIVEKQAKEKKTMKIVLELFRELMPIYSESNADARSSAKCALSRPVNNPKF